MESMENIRSEREIRYKLDGQIQKTATDFKVGDSVIVKEGTICSEKGKICSEGPVCPEGIVEK